MEGKKREKVRESGDGMGVKEEGLIPYTSSGQVYKVNHGGVSKKTRDWANLHRGPAWAR